MALSQKTVRYAWTSLTTATLDLTDTSLGSKTIYIPETTSRTIRSAWVLFSGQDVITATGGSVNRIQTSCVIDAVAPSVINDAAATLANTGENIALHWLVDFTSYFVTNFTGSSHSVELRWLQSQSTGTTAGYRNISAELFITYDYDDSDSTHIKTVVIPLESRTTALATTLTEIGTNQIPILTGAGGLLPESGITIRDYYFVLEGNEQNAAGTTDWTLGIQIDSDPEFPFGAQESALASDRFCRWVYSLGTVPTTTVVHQFKARSNALARLNHMSITLVVTYEFTPPSAGANRAINSLVIPFTAPPPMGGTAATDNSRVRVPVNIQEPGTIDLKQSGVQIFFSSTAAVTGLNIRAGTQAYRAYTNNNGVMCGAGCVQFRIDSGAAGGAALTLARGVNYIDIDFYRTSTTILGTGISGFVVLNYESDTSTGGVSRHTRTSWKFGQRSQLANPTGGLATVTAFSPVIPETNHMMAGPVGWFTYILEAAATNKYALNAELLSGEHAGDGWKSIDSGEILSDAELGVFPRVLSAGGDFFKRWWNDSESTRAEIESPRRYQMYALTATKFTSLVLLMNYSSQYFSVTGTVTGSAGGTVDLKAYRVSDGLLVGSTSRIGDGSYTIEVPTDDQVFVEARESSTLLGRSDNDVPTRVA